MGLLALIDEIDRIQPLMDFMQDDQNKKAIHQLSAVLGRMRIVIFTFPHDPNGTNETLFQNTKL